MNYIRFVYSGRGWVRLLRLGMAFAVLLAATRLPIKVVRAAPAPIASKPAPEFEPSQVLVKFKAKAGEPDLPMMLKKSVFGSSTISRIKLRVAQAGLYQLWLAAGINQADFIQHLEHTAGVVYAEPNYVYHLADFVPITLKSNSSHLTPNDPLLSGQYYLNNTSVPAAWNLTTGNNLTVAVEDSGVRFDHPDLVGRLRSDGFNFVNDSGDVSDDLGHGTEVTGLIAANSNNGVGIAGISWAAQILPVKIANAQGSIEAIAAAEGIYYAVQHGARVLNLSYGGETSSGVLEDAVAFALANQVTVVAAAGNAPDGAAEYPAAYSGVVAVTATDAADKLAFFDSYGSYVSLSAPGVDILTTTLNHNGSGDYSLHSGTSFSSPIVAGAVALMLSLNPYLRPTQILEALTQTADKVYPFDQAYYYYYGTGRLNVFKALQFVATLPVVPLVPISQANLIFSQQLSPNQSVRPGDVLRQTVSASNLKENSARSAYLNVSLDPNLSLQYVLTQPNLKNEWVTGVYSDHFNIQLGSLAPMGVVTFTAVYLVNPTATLGTLLAPNLSGFWSDDGAGGSNEANAVSVTIGETSANASTSYRVVSLAPPNGKAGQVFQLTTSGFAPHEPVALWLNLPDGSVQAMITLWADRNGAINYQFDSGSQKQRGDYGLVAQGQVSQSQIVAYFSLR